jgi:hypothetical protein
MELTCFSITRAVEDAKKETSMKQAASLPPASHWFIAFLTPQL